MKLEKVNWGQLGTTFETLKVNWGQLLKLSLCSHGDAIQWHIICTIHMNNNCFLFYFLSRDKLNLDTSCGGWERVTSLKPFSRRTRGIKPRTKKKKVPQLSASFMVTQRVNGCYQKNNVLLEIQLKTNKKETDINGSSRGLELNDTKLYYWSALKKKRTDWILAREGNRRLLM